MRHAALTGLAAALDLDCGDRIVSDRNEVNLVRALAPPEEVEALLGRTRKKTGANGRLDEVTAPRAIRGVRCLAKEIEVVGEGGGAARVLQLAEHLVV